MIFQRINRTDAEKVFSVLQNVSAATISAGAVAALDFTSSVDGVRVSQPATASFALLMGVAAEAVADSAFGKFQVYGYNSQVYVTNDTSTVVASGDILVPVNAVNNLARQGAGNAALVGGSFIYNIATIATATTPAAAQVKAFIRCL